MPRPDLLLKKPVAWLLLLAAVNFFAMLGGPTLWDVDEPNNAVCAREMLLGGNWWVPMFNGDLRFDKPILLYWLMIPLDALFGVNEWTARLPSALAITGLVFVTWKMGCRLLGDRLAALMAATLLVSALHIAVIAHAAVPDPLLMLALGFALPAIFIAYREQLERPATPMPGLLVAAYVAIGLGVLAKGPIAGLMPLLIFAGYITLAGEWRNWRLFHPFKGAAIALAVALPWYITVGILTDGEWLKGFLFHHNLDRFTDSLQGHKGFPGFYLLSFLLGWFPWSGMLAAALLFGAWRLMELRRQPLRLFLLCWIGMFILFFSVARTQLPNYVLPAFPAAALLMAYEWLYASETMRQRMGRWLVWVALLLSIVLIVGGGIALDKMWPGEGIYVLFLLPVALVAAWWLRRKEGEPWPLLAVGMAGSLLILSAWSLPAIDHHKVAKHLAKSASEAGFDGQSLATFHYFQPSLLFYHGGRLPMLITAREVGDWLTRGKAVVIAQPALAELPPEILPHLIVHERVYGMYARKWLLLVSLPPVGEKAEEGATWQSR